uniref:H(+)-transporting two-sector ATPase n=2 Tax=Podocarpus macrophyllus TaxID=58043 RepID=A0A6M3X3G2_9CONI|nr:ATP synthase F0 subunit 8 [Podocarpus macrophyllus]
MMPQLDQFTYPTQFFRCRLIFLAYYLCPCNDGLPRLSRIPKPRNQLVPRDNIRINNPSLGLEEILVRVFLSGTSHMYSSLSEISRWCDADLLGREKKITSLSCFGEISGSRGMESNMLYLIPKYSYSTTPNPLSGWRNRENIMLIHVPHGQVNI